MLTCYISIFSPLKELRFPSHHQYQIINALKVEIPSCTFLYALGHSSVFCVSICWIGLACFTVNPNLGLTCFHTTCFYLLYFTPRIMVFEVGNREESFGLCYAFSLWEEVYNSPSNLSFTILETIFKMIIFLT